MTPRWVVYDEPGGGGGGPWEPSQLAALSGWWDASDSSTLFDATSGGSTPPPSGDVLRIEDRSGNGFDLTQATAANAPYYETNYQNGLSVLRFDIRGQNLRRSTVPICKAVDGFSCFAVVKGGQFFSTAGYVFNVGTGVSDATRAHLYLFGLDEIGHGGRRLDADSFAQKQTPTSNFVNSFVIAASEYDYSAAESNACLDGVQYTPVSFQSSGQTSATDSFRVSIGANLVDAANFGFDGRIGEVIAVDAKLSQADREKVEGYLAHKWGLAGNLPVSHPYKNAAP